MNRSIRFGAICLVLAAILWSFTGVFVKHFSLLKMDGDVQNLFRYAAATVGLWLWLAFTFRTEALDALRCWRLFLLPTGINCVFQVAMVSGLYRQSIYPGFMSLLSQSSVLFSTGLAYVLFREERRTIRSPRFILGSLLAAGGVAGVIMFGRHARADFNEGVLLVLLSAFLWAGYTLSMKPVVKRVRPIVAFSYVATYTTVFFIVLAALRSRPAQFLEVSALDQFWVILSGVACISVAHSLYFRAVERLGVAVCGSFLLVQPLLTNVLSAVALGERLTAMQIPMGLMLLAGAALVILARRAGGREEESPPAETPEL